MSDTIVRTGDGFMRSVSENDRLVSYRLSDDSLDRAGTKIDPRGIGTDNYSRNPVFLWGHDGYGGFSAPEMANVIGRGVRWGVTELSRRAAGDDEEDGRAATAAFDLTAEFASEDINPRGELAFRMVKGGFLNAVSIGLTVQDWERQKLKSTSKKGGVEIVVFTVTDMLEASLVPIPANPNATQLAMRITKDYTALDVMPSDTAEALQKWLHEKTNPDIGQSEDGVSADATKLLFDAFARRDQSREQTSAFADMLRERLHK